MVRNIYLAGGFHSDWQEQVEKGFRGYENVRFYNPKTKQYSTKIQESYKKIFSNPHNYVNWDLSAIDRSEIVFAYIEKTNPAVGVIFEIGYAIAKGIKVILIIEEEHEIFKDRYFDILREKSLYNCTTLQEGIDCLKNTLILF